MSKRVTFLTIAAILLVTAGIALSWVSAETNVDPNTDLEPAAPNAAGEAEGELPPPTDSYCLLCHSQPDRVWELPSGETLSLTIDEAMLSESVHGEENPNGPLACADCHVDHRFPHPPQASQTIREFKLERYTSCRNCHEDQYMHEQDSVHGVAIRSGREEAAVCVDCHGGHDVQAPNEPRELISVTCGRCHGAIFEEYRNSVHGDALLADSNPDVPTCIDCHGVHDIQNPMTSLFRTRSPELCAGCHADSELMDQFDLTSNVFDSYLSDFHGTTVALFEQEDPNVATNKAVCYDCHGVHNILSTKDENSQVVQENLLTTCQQCHPGATSQFPDSWIGHREPTLESQPLLYLVNLFYNLLIPVVIGGFLFLIATDVFYRIRRRLGNRQGAQ